MPGERQFSREFQRKYRITRLLGTGGMAQVYLAWDLQLSREVAIKFLGSFQDSPDSGAGLRFQEEARVCATLKHPNIVRLYSSGWERETPFLVFEFIEGKDLSKELAVQGRLTPERTLALADGILAGLQLAHVHQVVHRDIKPANVLLRLDNGEPMLMDFGVAKAKGRDSFATEANLVLGTPAYMAPETIRGGAVSPASDIYSLGCTLYECLAGAPPLMGKTEIATLELQLHQAPRPLRRLNPEVPDAVDALVMRALEKEPSRRFPSAKEMGAQVVLLRWGNSTGALQSEFATEVVRLSGEVHKVDDGGGAGPTAPPAGRPPADRQGYGRTVAVPSANPRRRDLDRSHHTIATSRPPVSVKPGGRSFGVAALGVVGAIAVVLVLVFSLRTRADQVRAVKITIWQGGTLEATWESQRGSSGKVLTSKLAGAAAGSVDAALVQTLLKDSLPWKIASEDQERKNHLIRVKDLEAGTTYLVVVPDADGKVGWFGTATVPETEALWPVPGKDGEPTCAVSVPSTGPCEAVLVFGGSQSQRRFRPTSVAGGRTMFALPVSAAALPPGTHVQLQPSPSMTVSWNVVSIAEIADRIVAGLGSFNPKPLLARLTGLKEFKTDTDFRRARGEGWGVLATSVGETVAVRRAEKGFFLKRIEEELSGERFFRDYLAFKPFANTYFTSADVTDEKKTNLYEALLKLQYFDILIGTQEDDRVLGVSTSYARFVRSSRALFEIGQPIPAAPGEVAVSASPSAWWSSDSRSPELICSFAQMFTVFGWLFPKVDLKDCKNVTPQFAHSRSYELEHLPAGARTGVATLRAVFCLLGPAYAFSLGLKGKDGASLRFLVTNPGTGDWIDAMDDPDPGVAGEGAGAAGGSRFRWGVQTFAFPARLLPTDRATVEVHYLHLPGLPQVQLSSMPRTGYLNGLYLSVETKTGHGPGPSVSPR
ncbi:MAG: serine/threonine protein kinase [Candidatus Riflebacteria bacterium]|nr:serine/threonine protein kinase [Candidatus Riflebacteria bacterium]